MSTFSGMDPDAVDALAARLQLQAHAVAAIVSVVDGAVAGLAGVWSGDDLHAFAAVWQQTHRPRAQSLSEQLSTWVSDLRQQVTQQRIASGETVGGAGSGMLGSSAWGQSPINREWELLVEGGGLIGGSFLRAWNETDLLRSAKDITQETLDLQVFKRSGEEGLKAFKEAEVGPGFRQIDSALTVAGFAIDGGTLVHGLATHNASEEALSGAELIVDTSTAAAERVPVLLPVALAAQITYAVGTHVFPVDEHDFDGSYNMALRDHFGPSYDPENPTESQATWAMDHYSGPAGMLHSTVDGIKYKAEHGFGLRP